MDIVTLVAFTIAYAIAVVVPGPGVAAVVARALGGGFRGAVPMVLGILAGDLIYLVFALFGLAAIATWFGPVFVVIRWAGFLAVNKVENSAAFTVSVYAVPLLTMALCVYFISSSRMLELPAPVTERAASIADRIVEKTAALRLRLSGYKRPTARSSA